MSHDSTPKFATYEPDRPGGRRAAPTIRSATDSDVTAIARLAHEREGGALPDQLRAIEAQASGSDRLQLFVATLTDQVVAFGRLAYFVPDDDAPANTVPEGWLFAGLIVDPRYRRRSIGLALTEHRLQWLTGRAAHAHYFANAENQPTIDLHEKLGFVEVTRDFTFPGVSFSGRGVGVLFRIRVPPAPANDEFPA